MEDFWIPLQNVSGGLKTVHEYAYLVHNVLKRIGAINGKTNKNNVGFGVGERAQPVVLFLPGRIPESKLDHLACGWMWSVGDVILKDGRHVFLDGISMIVMHRSKKAIVPLGSGRSYS